MKMKRVTKVVTFDQVVHNTQATAEMHLNRLYSDLVTKLAHSMVNEVDGRHGKAGAWIERHIPEFITLNTINADRQLEPLEEE